MSRRTARLKALFKKRYAKNEYDKIIFNINQGLKFAKTEEDKDDLLDFYIKLFRTELAATSRVNCFKNDIAHTIESFLPEKHLVDGKIKRIEYKSICKQPYELNNETIIFTWRHNRLPFLFFDLKGKKWVEGPERESIYYKEFDLLEVESGRHSATICEYRDKECYVTANVVSLMPYLEEIDTDGIYWYHGDKKVDVVMDVRVAVLWELASRKLQSKNPH